MSAVAHLHAAVAWYAPMGVRVECVMNRSRSPSATSRQRLWAYKPQTIEEARWPPHKAFRVNPESLGSPTGARM